MREQAFDPGAGCGAGRDALPDLLHGRLVGEARARAEAHVAACSACAAELALLRSARGAIVAAAPPVDMAAIAAVVRAATVRASAPAIDAGVIDAVPARVARPVTAPIAPRRARTRWRGARYLRALAAMVLAAVGAGAAAYGWSSRDGTQPVRSGVPAVAATPADGPPTSAMAPDQAVLAVAGPTLGARFDDLSDEELQAVIAAIDGSDAALVSFEPDPATPAVGGGG